MGTVPGSAGSDAGPPDHGLDPLTLLALAVATLVAAILIDSALCLVLLGMVAVVVPAAWARSLRRVARSTFLLSLPLAISAVIINVLFPDDGQLLAELGPLHVTDAGLALAATVLARILVMAGAVVLFYATTSPARLSASLQWHGLSARAAFVIHNGVAMMPRLAERARAVSAAQRARGLDTEGNVLRRARGVLAVAAPTVLGAIAEAEARTLALETRGFTRSGRHTLMWTPPDSTPQRTARWGLLAGLLLLVAVRALEVELPC